MSDRGESSLSFTDDVQALRFETAALALVTDVVIGVDPEQRIMYWNAPAERLYGYARSDVLGMPLTDVVGYAFLNEEAAELAYRSLEETGRWGGEVVHRRRDESTFVAHAEVVRLPDDVMLSTITVLDDLQVARAAALESDARFRTLVAQTGDGIFLVDRDGRFLDVSESLCAMLDEPREELLGRAIEAIVDPDDLVRLPLVLRSLRAGEAVTLRRTLVTAGGDRVPVTLRERSLGDGVVQGVVHDLRAELEAERDRALLVAALEQSGDGIVVADATGVVRFANPFALRIFADSFAGPHTPATLAAESRHAWDSMAAEVDRSGEWSGRLVFEIDGARLELDHRVSPVRGTEGEVLGSLGVTRDVSRERELERRLEQAQKMEAIGRLAGGIAHDFNNLLTGIRGYTDLAIAEVGDSLVAEDLEAVRDAADRAAHLTSQLLAFARRQVLHPEPVDLNEVVEAIMPLLRRLVREEVEIETALERGHGLARVDRAQVEQVVVNLVVNAGDAIAAQGCIRIATREVTWDAMEAAAHAGVPPGRYAILEVTDDGGGMDEETRARIFEPFFTTKDEGHGSGLGLATVHGIAHQSGGTVTVYSEPGLGTTMRVYLPVVEGKATAARALEPEDVEVPPARPGERVLVAEDDAAVRSLTRRILERLGYEVKVAESGPEALERIAAGASVDLLVTDFVMPGMRGTELAEAARELVPGLPVLVVSGYPRGAEASTLEQSAFLAKPFAPHELAQVVRTLLDRPPEQTP